MPGAENVAEVAATAGSVNVTDPGPDTCVYTTVNVEGGFGRPSSVTLPSRKNVLTGLVMLPSGPALTRGAAFPPGSEFTVIVTVSLDVATVSFPVIAST